MRPRREDILEQLRACAIKLGHTPGQIAFRKMAGLREADIRYYWPRYSDLAREAGLEPNTAEQQIPEDDLFREYARVCIHVQHIPTYAELQIATRELGTRTHSITRRYDSMAAFRQRFRQWLEHQDGNLTTILDFEGWEPQSFAKAHATQPAEAKPVFLFHPFLPASLQYLDVLARGDRPPFLDPKEPISSAFERRCTDAFRCWGFEVNPLGQGKGRVADCVAMARQDGFAVIVDAKVRSGGYSLGTEDRKFYEYASNHARELEHQGISKTYLVVVGSAFRQDDLNKLTNYLAGSPVRSVDLMTARALMRLVEASIRERYRFRLSQVDQLLFGNKIISE